MAIDTCVENFSGVVMKALAPSTPKCRPRGDPLPPISAGIQDELRLKKRLRRQWQVTRGLALRAEDNRCWPAGSTSGGMTSGMPHSNPSIPKINLCGEWPKGWWEFLLRDPPDYPWGGNRSLRLWESRSPCQPSGDSDSACYRSFVSGSYGDGWRGAVVLLSDAYQQLKWTNPDEVQEAIRWIWWNSYEYSKSKYTFHHISCNIQMLTNHFCQVFLPPN